MLNYVNPKLTEKNKMERLRFVMNQVDEDTMLFKSQKNRIHQDKKWFYLGIG
jgi:hypothetical protein